MTPVEQLRTALAALSLTAIDARLEGILEGAAKKEPSYADFLLEVMSTEADARRPRYLKARLQLAHLPYVRTLRFVHEASNVILLGPLPWPWPRLPSSPAAAPTS